MESLLSVISSRANPRFKQWRRYLARPQDADCPWIALEGWRAIGDLAEKQPIQVLLLEEGLKDRGLELVRRSRQVYRLPAARMRELSTLETPPGVMAFFNKPAWSLAALPKLVLYLDRLRDPGNLGTLLRTAAATGGGLVTSQESVSFFNSKVVRASAASLFTTPFLSGCSAQEIRERGYRLIAATPGSGTSLFEYRFAPPCAVAIGTEGAGLAREIRGVCEDTIRIPMLDESESLNAAVAGSLILYEAFRKS